MYLFIFEMGPRTHSDWAAFAFWVLRLEVCIINKPCCVLYLFLKSGLEEIVKRKAVTDGRWAENFQVPDWNLGVIQCRMQQ